VAVPTVAASHYPVHRAALCYGEAPRPDPDNCDCVGLACDEVSCPRWWAVMFVRLEDPEFVEAIARLDEICEA